MQHLFMPGIGHMLCTPFMLAFERVYLTTVQLNYSTLTI